MLTNGKGPTIVSYPELAETKTGEIVEMSNASFTAKTNTINISPEIVGVLEFELNPGGESNLQSGLGGIAPDKGDKQLAFKILGAQLGHEGVHKLRNQNKKPVRTVDAKGKDKEAGELFEEKAFGKNQGRLRVKDLRKANEKERSEADSEKYNYNSDKDSSKASKAKKKK